MKTPMIFKAGCTAALLAGWLAAAPMAVAEDQTNALMGGTLSGSVTLTSDYTSRALTQNDEKPALMGSLVWTHSSGVHANLFAANVDFNNTSNASTELDYALGYGFNLGEKTTGDVTLWYYTYPGVNSNLNYDYFEAIASLTHNFGFLSTTAWVAYSPEYFGKSGDALYGELMADVPVTAVEGLTLHGSIGRQDIDKNGVYGYPNWSTWKLGASYALPADLSLRLDYIDTSLTKAQCADGCEERMVISLTKTF